MGESALSGMADSGDGEACAPTGRVMLCDAAQEHDGKLFIIGGGWVLYRGTPLHMALAAMLAISAGREPAEHAFRAELARRTGGPPVLAPPGQPPRPTPISTEGTFVVAAAEDHPTDLPVSVGLTMSLFSVYLVPDDYRWTFSVDGHVIDGASFRVVGS